MTERILKIAAPTDDGFILGKQFKGSRAFLVTTTEDGKIINQELRWNLLSEIMTSELGYFYNLSDCDILIVSEIGQRHREMLEARNIRIHQTDSGLIADALMEFVPPLPDLIPKI
jgi:predicted Fe-Mo cluster-binding NifX family protein